MKKIIRSLMLTLLGGLVMTSCGETATSNTPANSASATQTKTTETQTTTDSISMKKTSVLIKGVNQSVDLKDCFEFGGNLTINNVTLDINGYEQYCKLDGSVLTGLALGKVSVNCKFKATDSTSKANLKLSTINVYVINPSDTANSFTSNDIGDYKMTLETKSDGSFSFTRPEGTCSAMSSSAVSAATLTGTYKLEEDGLLHFTLDTASLANGINFTMTGLYGNDMKEEDNNDFFLYGKVPAAKDTLSSTYIQFVIASTK